MANLSLTGHGVYIQLSHKEANVLMEVVESWRETDAERWIEEDEEEFVSNLYNFLWKVPK